MALLDDINQRGSFNSAGRGARAAQGVDYFSSLVPSSATILEELPADAGLRRAPPEPISSGGGSSWNAPMSPETIAFLDKETLDQRGARLSGAAGDLVQTLAGAIIPGYGLAKGAYDAYQGFNAVDGPNGAGPTGGWADGLGRSAGLQANGMADPYQTPGAYAAARMSGDPMGAFIQGLNLNRPETTVVGDPNPQTPNNAVDLPPVELGTSSSGYGGWDSGGGGGEMSGTPNTYTGFTSGSMMAADGGMATSEGFSRPVGLSIPGYADGGPMTPNGPMLAMGFAGGGAIGGPEAGASPDMINMRVNQMSRDPRFQQQVMQTLQPLMQSGELTEQEVVTMGQIAEASLQNPKLYPQLRQFVAQQGMSPLPPAFDPSVIMKILAISRALGQSAGGAMAMPGQGQPTPPGQVPPTSQAQMQNPNGMANGGFLQGPGTGRSDSIGTINESSGQPVKVANGEYVIPKHVVDAKGRDFFDSLLRRYSEVPKVGE